MRIVAGASLLCVTMALAACQGDAGSALNLGLGKRTAESQEGAVRESELRAFCPRVTVREGTALYRSFEKKGEEDPSNLAFQASIADVTRSCTYQPGQIIVNVALAGKVVPGPKAPTGVVTMPVRIVAMNGTEVIYSQLHNFQVTLDRNVGATQFIVNDPAVVVPRTSGPQLQIIAGYDEGPVKKSQ